MANTFSEVAHRPEDDTGGDIENVTHGNIFGPSSCGQHARLPPQVQGLVPAPGSLTATG